MRSTAPITGRLVELNDRRLWLHQSGEGGPVVVFLPGAGGMALDYLLAHDLVAEFTTSVLYDRAGTGWSDDAELPRTLDEVTDELRNLLATVGLSGPYVLVGHSLGGAYAQRYAQRFPAETAAILLLDPLHADYDNYMPDHLKLAANTTEDVELPELTDEFVSQVRAVFATSFGPLPEHVREQVIDKHVSPERLPTGLHEGLNVLALLEELRAGGPLPDVPLIVLSGASVDASQTMFQPEELVREQVTASHVLYDAIAAKSPRGEHHSLPTAAHVTLPLTHPHAIATAVHTLIHQS
ncbi:alpha/beta fold hydrolase [Kribbella deserti]|uniref:Alpha/beta fold hydrolase n=1 Tax=Kribbella deserti TaxID=1926257 RepID=A0ABV6QHT3_9ACTN